MPIPDAEAGTIAETPLGPYLGAAALALGDEAEATDRLDQVMELGAGRRLVSGEVEHLYRFEAANVGQPEAETPLRIDVGGDAPIAASIVEVGECDLLVSTASDLGERVPRARARSSLGFIPRAMRGRILGAMAEPATRDMSVVRQLLGLEPPPVEADEGRADATATAIAAIGGGTLAPNRSQRLALARIAGSRLHMVWGPPGTGKTTSLAHAVRMLVDAGERVAVVAHANVAVDAALMRCAEMLEGTGLVEAGEVVRVGPPRLRGLDQRGAITADAVLAQRSPDIVAALASARRDRDTALDAARAGSAYDPDRMRILADARARVRSLERKVRDAEAALLGDARVVGATLSRLVLTNALWDWAPDTVILDEAAAVGAAHALAAALTARRRMVLFGDFRQLPPVVVATGDLAGRWLSRSAFATAGVEAAVDAGEEHPAMTLLDAQYRMAREIGDAVSRLAYDGRVRTVDNTAVRRIAGRPPFPGERAVVVDTDGLGAWALTDTATSVGSRANPISAALAVEYAAEAASSGASVAVITPYRAQARLLWAMVQDGALDERVVAATVHRFQGSESDVVVMDLADAPPLNRPTRLTGVDADTTRRVMNVAVSRGRGRVIVLMSRGLTEAHVPANSPLERMWSLLGGPAVTRPATMPRGVHGPFEWATDWATAARDLGAQLGSNQRRIASGPAAVAVSSPHVAVRMSGARTAQSIRQMYGSAAPEPL